MNKVSKDILNKTKEKRDNKKKYYYHICCEAYNDECKKVGYYEKFLYLNPKEIKPANLWGELLKEYNKDRNIKHKATRITIVSISKVD